MMDMKIYADYARQLRHELHRCPEIGYDLTKTTAIVRRELEANGISYTEKWSRSSVVATIGEGNRANFTIALRADMDALPITEQPDHPYRSEHEGQMHACGHDVHTSNLLAVGKWLKDHEADLRCRVLLLFTPAEEYIDPGCRELAESGVMDEIDCLLGQHVDPTLPVGTVGIYEKAYASNSMGFTVEFFGKSSHVAHQDLGCDANLMAVEAIGDMENMVAKEFHPTEPRLLNVGTISGGQGLNIISSYCKITCSARAWKDEVSEKLERRVQEICNAVASQHGGTCRYTRNKLLPFALQNDAVEKAFGDSVAKLGLPTVIRSRGLGGEDFGFLSRKTRAYFYHVGTSSGPATSYSWHTDRFDVDEACYETMIKLMTGFVLDHMDGI